MNILDAYKRVIKTTENIGDLAIEQPLMYLFDVDLSMSFDWFQQERRERFVGYWLRVEAQSGHWIGTVVYFLDDKPVLVAHQAARKGDAKVFFIDEEGFQAVRDYVITFRQFNERDAVMLTNDSFELKDFAVYGDTEHHLEKHAVYQEQLVPVERLHYEDPKNRSEVVITIYGERKNVHISEVKFPLRLTA
jgi:hypothetical protein